MSSISGLVLWLDANSVDGQQNTNLDNGSSVSQWTELSGNGYSLTQSLSTKPTFSTSGLNGKNTVSFNGNSNLYSDNFTELTTDNYTILVVTQLDNSTGGDQALLSMTDVSANAGLGITKISWGGHRWIVLHRMPKGNSGGNTRYGFNSDTQPHLLMVERKANGSSTDDLNLFLDNESNSSVNNDLTSILNMINFESSLKYLSFGSIYYSSLSRPFDGGISEVLIYTKALATQEMAEVKYYLSQKWGLTSSVDSDGDGTVDANDADPLN